MKKVFSTLLSLAMVVAMGLSLSITANAEEAKQGYTYTVKYHLAGTGNENAAYVADVSELIASRNLVVASSTAHGYNAVINGDTLEVSGLYYKDRVTFHAKSAVTVNPNENGYTKYYVKGARKAGADASAETPSFEVTKDQEYVIAYGVGEVISYTVRYVDGAGNALLPEQKYYAPLGEEIYVAYRYIDGYVPNTYNYHMAKLEPDTVFTFTYTPGTAGSEVVEYTTIGGGGAGGIEYVTLPGGTTYVTVPGGTSYVTVAGAAGGGAGAGAGAGGAGGGAAAAAGDGGAGDGGAAIADDATPAAGPAEVTEIGDAETPLAGAVKENAFPIFAWVIVAIAAATVIAAVIMLNKRKKAVATSSKSEAPKKED